MTRLISIEIDDDTKNRLDETLGWLGVKPSDEAYGELLVSYARAALTANRAMRRRAATIAKNSSKC